MSDQALMAALFVSLAATVAALGATVVTASRHLVPAHIKAVVAFVALLLVTLVFAELLGARFEFGATAKSVHLTFAWITAVGLLGPLGTGVQHWRGKLGRAAHVWVVRAFLLLVVLTLATGIWMFTERSPKPREPAAAPAAAPEPAG